MNLLKKLRQSISPSIPNPDYCFTLDIGTEMVKVLLFKNENGVGKVVGTGRQSQSLHDMQGGTVTDIQGVLENCRRALAQAEEQSNMTADQVIIGIAGELVKGSTTIVEYERPKPQERITLKELHEIVKNLQWKAFEQVRSQLAKETGYQEVEVQLVNAAIVDVQIDGHRVNNPIGFQGKNVSIGIFNSFAPLVHLGALETIADELELDLLSIACEPYAVALCKGTKEAGEFSAIFIDIGGGTTDVAVVRNGGITGTKMFSLGGRAFTKRLASHFDIPFKKAEQMKIDYSNNKLDPTSHALVKKILLADAKVWMSGIELVLDELAKSEHLPSRIMLCGGGSALPEIKKVLDGFAWQKNLPFTRDPQVSFIQPQDVDNIQDLTGDLTSSQDITPMALANLALDLMGEESVIDSVIRKVSQAIQH